LPLSWNDWKIASRRPPREPAPSHTPAKRSGPTWQVGRWRATGASAMVATTDDATATVAAVYHHPRARGWRASVASSASIEGQRSSGSFANPRSSARLSQPGTRLVVGAARRRPRSTLSASSANVLPANGRSPYRAS